MAVMESEYLGPGAASWLFVLIALLLVVVIAGMALVARHARRRRP